jgi:hypothetical protein
VTAVAAAHRRQSGRSARVAATNITPGAPERAEQNGTEGVDMRHRPRILACVSLWLMLAATANAQQPQTHIPGAPAAKGASGSCMYGGDGKLLFAPKGAACPERQQPPASLAETPVRESAPRQDAPPAKRNAMPAELRAEAAALFEERERLDVELARVREAVAYEDREAARRVAEASLAKIARHLEREARLLREIAVSGAR